jgi:uncharacterized protein YprB with RNaseH-like and TPR domain
MSLPDATSVRDRLRRLGAVGSHLRTPTAAAEGRGPVDYQAGDSVEVVRSRYGPGHRHGRQRLADVLDALTWPGTEVDIQRTLWLDTETTGLAGGTGTRAFLIGAAYFEGGALLVEQFLLRRLSAEGRLLTALRDRLGGVRHLVTFNGQRFDWPILETRFLLARQQPVALELHTDLIHPARRLWHRVLGTHRLSILESEVLGAPRTDDVQGWEIPMIYVEYLRTSDRRALDPVLLHNRADLLALVILHGEVVRTLRDPWGTGIPLDWEGAGVLLGRQGNPRQAAACFERAVREVVEPRDRWRVLRRLTREYRALGDEQRVSDVWEKALDRWIGRDRYRVHLLEEVSKVRRRRGDGEGAQAAAREALSLALSLGDTNFGAGSGDLLRCVERLRRRLRRAMERDREPALRTQHAE